LVLKSISDILSILFTSLAVTGVKVVIISWVIIIVENIVNKLKLNSEMRKNNVKIKVKGKNSSDIINSKEIINYENEVLDKLKILI